MSAVWQASFAAFSALRALRDNDHEAMFGESRSDPLVEQIRTAQSTDHRRRKDEYKRCSPDARLIPEVADALDRAREMPVEPCGVAGSFWLSNCGRRLQRDRDPSLPAQGYDDRLRLITIEQFVTERGPQARLELKRAEHDYVLAAEVAEYGGSPIATVIVYSPRDGIGREYLVSQGWTRDRVVRYLTRTERFRGCMFCDHDGDMDTFVKVDCGAVRRVFPVCSACESRLQVASDYGLDFELAWDDWHQAVGWPDDRFV
ncbi:hypothetical protein GPOL_c26650 [Gordonia polyisoprenivorans VH2]|uniref:Uncharacterized protein n=1 Tax=Gordonia polyisoprenivorans (strain DSM 44266 / VH2) TaxID=1112204 RepID=H6MQY9_GORPV|nr:hypothetical protein [Gordonia polyisoprenivorans]AFA73686.1 hypothetical protein GPOL_c26650 [Gordonia polyisoprenivorans VH2]